MAARKDRAGRPGGSELTRLMLAILGGLTEDGDMVNVHAVARRFSNSDDFAERLIESIKVLPAGDDFFLPLYFKDGDPDVALVEGGVRGRRLRLTRDETFALIAAFDRIGISESNSLRKSIMGTMASLDVSADETQRTDAPSGGSDTTALERCVQALCTGRRIVALCAHLVEKIAADLLDKSGRHVTLRLSEEHSLSRHHNEQVLFCSCNRYIHQSAFFLKIILGLYRPVTREDSLFGTYKENGTEFQSLGAVYGHEPYVVIRLIITFLIRI